MKKLKNLQDQIVLNAEADALSIIAKALDDRAVIASSKLLELKNLEQLLVQNARKLAFSLLQELASELFQQELSKAAFKHVNKKLESKGAKHFFFLKANPETNLKGLGWPVLESKDVERGKLVLEIGKQRFEIDLEPSVSDLVLNSNYSERIANAELR